MPIEPSIHLVIKCRLLGLLCFQLIFDWPQCCINIQQRTCNKDDPSEQTHPVEQIKLLLNLHIAHAYHALQVSLQHTCKSQGNRHKCHGSSHNPEAPHIENLVIRLHPTQMWQRIGKESQIEHDISAIKSQMSMRCGNLRTMAIKIDRGETMQQSP